MKKKKSATIRVLVDPTCKMAVVHTYLSGKREYSMGMSGNYWDFHPGCHVMREFGDFNSSFGLALGIQKHLEKKDYKVKVVTDRSWRCGIG